MKIKRIVMMGIFALCGSTFGALINGSQFVDQDWSADANISMTPIGGGTPVHVGFIKNTGANGVAPSVGGGEVNLTMVGATGGETRLSTGALDPYEFHNATNYIVTTRMKVTQFDNGSMTVSTPNTAGGIAFFDIRGHDRAFVRLEADGLWMQVVDNSWQKISSATTLENTYYTWQFEVSQVVGAGAGTMDVFRRVSDLDAWTPIASGVSLRDQNAADQLLMYRIFDNSSTGGTQGALSTDYLQIGQAIPEPSTLGLIAAAAGLLMVVRNRFMM